MKGLLLKDAYQIWHYAKGVIVATVVMMGAGVVTIMNGVNFFIVYAGFLMGMMPMTLLAYDQASKFSEYSAALPVTKEQLVGSKYIIGLCGLVLAELFAAAALGVASLHWTAVDHALVVSTLVQVGMTTLLNSAVLLPLNYRFGYEKAKYAFYLMVGLAAALMGFGVSANEDGPGPEPSAAGRSATGSAGHCTDRSGAVLPLLAAVRCLVRKGRAVK